MTTTPIYDALVIERAGQEAREYVRAGLASHLAPVAYDDDRPGMMRVHIAQERAQALSDKYTVKELRLLARSKSISPKLRKYDLAVQLAFAGVKA